MRIGLVKYLNAQPLEYGIRQKALREELTVVDETPAVLYRMLLDGELDAALISSVECLRNASVFGYCDRVGVCSTGPVQSIVYIEKKSPGGVFSRRGPIACDNGSRSSVALLDILYAEQTGQIPELVQSDPASVIQTEAGLLIGDNALSFLESPQSEEYFCIDLCEWWAKREHLPFVFALWAYPKRKPIDDAFFESSLEEGMAAVGNIARESQFKNALPYLTEVLHFRLGEKDKKALALFREKLAARDLL